MRKGFLHVVEIIVVSALVLIILQLTYLPKQAVDWQGVELYTQANDMLFSLDRKGVDWFNSTEVGNSLSSYFSNSTIFTLKIKNAMKPSINVGCLVCSGAQVSSLQSILQPFEINSQPVTFSVASVTAFSHDNDVIVTFSPIAGSQYGQAYQFLGAGKGIVEFSHLAAGDMNTVQTGLFGLQWNATAKSLGTPIEFFTNKSSGPYYNIYKYFHSIPIFQDNFSSGWPGLWSPQTGTWNIQTENYAGTASPDAITITASPLQDSYSLRASIYPQTASHVKLIPYWQDIRNHVVVDFDVNTDTVTVFENITGNPVLRGSGNSPIPINLNNWYDAKIIPQGNTLKIYINGSYVFTSNPLQNIPASSPIGLGAENGIARFDNVRVTFSEKHNFGQLLSSGENVWPAGDKMEKIILLYRGAEPLPACIVNSNIVDDKGRTAWLAPGSVSSQEISNILRTLVVWAAGDENEVVKNDVKNVPVVVSLYKVYDQDMYQPVEVVLTMGNLYG